MDHLRSMSEDRWFTQVPNKKMLLNFLQEKCMTSTQIYFKDVLKGRQFGGDTLPDVKCV